MLLLLLMLIFVIIVVSLLLRIIVIDRLRINDIEGRVVLVTGSAGGFGRKFVAKCLENGMTVFAGCRTKESAEKFLEECKGMKGHLYAFEMDITSEESIIKAKEYIVKQLKKFSKELHAVVNNAGIQAECMFDDFIEMSDYEDAMRVNAYGAVRVTKAFKDLIKKSKGRIVFCTSAVCRFPAPGMGPYSMSKWALTGYIEVIRHELRELGVYVINVEPGIYCTPLNSIHKMMNAMNAVWARASQQLRDEYGEYWFSRGKRVYIDIHDSSPSDVLPVANAYFHAITARCPYRNYVVGLDARLLFQPFSWLPARLQETAMKIVEWHFGAPKPAIVD